MNAPFNKNQKKHMRQNPSVSPVEKNQQPDNEQNEVKDISEFSSSDQDGEIQSIEQVLNYNPASVTIVASEEKSQLTAIEKARLSDNPRVKGISALLDKYVNVMNVKNTIDARDGAMHQRSLWGGYKYALTCELDDSFKCLDLIVEYYKIHGHEAGVFGSARNRFGDVLNLSRADSEGFQFLNHVFWVLSTSGKSKTKTMINLERITSRLTDAAANNLVAYLNS